jgi:hypothetical protein
VTAAPLSPEAFYESAQRRAKIALEAHHDQDHGSVALNAGTALEHLAKACLAKRSPALITELRREQNYADLLQLLGYAKSDPERLLRTVGLRDALERVKVFVIPHVTWKDLLLLAGMRDGTVHAAMNDEVETRLLAAFAQYIGELLKDLDRDRADFWGDQLTVVDALLAHASDKLARDVAVKLAEADAYFHRNYGEVPTAVLESARVRFEADECKDDQMTDKCPVCGSLGLATGVHDVEWQTYGEGYRPIGAGLVVWFTPSVFECRVCRLRLNSLDEIVEAGMEPRWEHEGADPRKYEEPVDLGRFYDRYEDRY